MIILSNKYPGPIVICSNCGAALAYGPQDIYGKNIYCPLCKATTEVPYDKGYDGVVREEKKNV